MGVGGAVLFGQADVRVECETGYCRGIATAELSGEGLELSTRPPHHHTARAGQSTQTPQKALETREAVSNTRNVQRVAGKAAGAFARTHALLGEFGEWCKRYRVSISLHSQSTGDAVGLAQGQTVFPSRE